MIFFEFILLFLLLSNDSNEINSPDKLLDLARTGLEYKQDMYALAKLRYVVRKYPESEYSNEAFKELYNYYKEKGGFINAFMILEEFRMQFSDDPFIAGKLDELAWLYFKSGDYEGALRIYHKLSSDYPESEYTKDIEDLVLYVERVTMSSSSILGNFLWKVRLSLESLLDKFEIPYEISEELYFLLLKLFIFLFIMMLSYILFLSQKQNQQLKFWSSKDFAFIILFFCSFVLFVIFYFVNHIFLSDNIEDFPNMFRSLLLILLAFFLFKKNNPDFKKYFHLNLTELKKSLVIFFLGFIVLSIFIVFSGMAYSKTSAAIVSRNLEGDFRLNLSFPSLTFYYFLSLVLFAPIVEEIAYRGLLYESLKKKTSIVYGIMFSSLIFAFIHEFTNITFFSFFILGIIYALIFQKTRSLTLAILVHSFTNLLSLLGYLNY